MCEQVGKEAAPAEPTDDDDEPAVTPLPRRRHLEMAFVEHFRVEEWLTYRGNPPPKPEGVDGGEMTAEQQVALNLGVISAISCYDLGVCMVGR